MLTAAEEGMPLPLNGFEGQPVEWADPPEPLADIDWTETTRVFLYMPPIIANHVNAQAPQFHRHALLQ